MYLEKKPTYFLSKNHPITVILNHKYERRKKHQIYTFLNDGAMILDDRDFSSNLEGYLDEWDVEEEDRDEYRRMVSDKIPAGG